MKHGFRLAVLMACLVLPLAPMPAQAQVSLMEADAMRSLRIEDLTWGEIQNAMKFGYTNVIIPTGGMMQNGPHLPLSKHHQIVSTNADSLARRVGNTLVAPVIDLVPAGNIESREGHMNFPGTISIPAKVFADTIEYTVRSLAKHGFSQFFLIGDSSSAQPVQAQVAKALRQQGIAVYNIDEYHAVQQQELWLRQNGLDAAAIGGHAGLRDTSEFMDIAPKQVREYQLGVIPEESLYQYGAWGDTSRSSAALGQKLLQIKVDYAAAQICRDAQVKPGNCRR